MIVYDVFFWVVVIISYFFRDTPPFKQIWNIFKFILVIMFVALGVNFAKKSLKEWWNS